MEGDLRRKSLRGSKEQSKLTQNFLFLFIIHLKIFPDHLRPRSQGAAQEAEITHVKYVKNGLIGTTLLNIPHTVMHVLQHFGKEGQRGLTWGKFQKGVVET